MRIEFIKDFAGYKKGDVTDKVNNQVVSSLKTRGIAKDCKVKVEPKKEPVKKKVIKKDK